MAINFNLNDLQAFRAVAELGNFRKAADALHVSQPAFSRRIEKLEEALGVQLLERTTRRVSLTSVGRDFDRKVQQLLDDLDQTLLGIRGVATSRMGEVTIASVPSTVYYFLSQVISRYHERYPKIKVKVFDASANEVLSAVSRSEADFGLNFVGSQEPDIEFKPLIEERFVAACRIQAADRGALRRCVSPGSSVGRKTPCYLDRTGAIRLHFGEQGIRQPAVARSGAVECSGPPAEHLRNPARDDDARTGGSGAWRCRSALDGDARSGPPAPGERAAARPCRDKKDRPDPAQGPLLVAGGPAAL
jgi:DNA-binding transcriptional LysR family regulator